MTSYAVVAIPARDDYIWNISSEKVPHMTLLFLGEHLENLDQVESCIARVVDTTLSKFTLDVDRRDILGNQSADVLFFGQRGIKSFEEFRSYLLGDPSIIKAYNSVEQFPTWTPHLTLGYPETPAKPDKRDHPGTYSVTFDRIALWTGDFKGVEFPLKNNAAVDFVSMAAKGDDFVQHFGVKGMKWGVIRDKVRGNAAVKLASASEDHKRASAVKTKAKIVGVQALTNKDLQDVITRMNLEVSYKSLKTVEHEQSLLGKGKKWTANFLTDVLKDVTTSWFKRPGTNATGRTSARGRAWINGQPMIDGSFAPTAIGHMEGRELSGPISDRLRASLSKNDPSWTPQRPEPPVDTPKIAKDVGGTKMIGRNKSR